MLLVTLFTLISLLFWLLFYKELKKEIIIEYNNKKREQTKLAKMIKKASEKTREIPIDKGYMFSVDGDCVLIGSFYDKDVKFGTFCHVIDNKLVSYPGIVEISDNNRIIFQSKKITKEVQEKSMKMYMDFKNKNKNKFLEEEDEF